MIRHPVIGILNFMTISTVLFLEFSRGQVLYRPDNCDVKCFQKNSEHTVSPDDSHRREFARRIAFSVDFNGFQQLLNNTNQILVYKNVLVNHGSGYSTNSGIFTTPEAGMYAFFFSVQVFKNVRLSTFLRVNGKTASENLAGRTEDVNTGSNMVIVQLQKGDRVWVQTHPTNLDWINWSGEAVVKYSGNSFSGFLLF